MTEHERGRVVHDVVGVGFGPSNLALAVALAEHTAARPGSDPLDAVFVERGESFSWHPGMLLPGAGMQIAFPKDLATFRDPTSEYTFLNYLHDSGRLVDFVNRQSFFPSREEFADYLAWASRRVPAQVEYGSTVTRIDVEGDVARVTVAGADGAERTLDARSVVIGPGLAPRVPAGVECGPRVFHNHRILDRLPGVGERPHRRIVVVGAGQSAAECLQFLHARYPDSEVHGVFARFGLSPSDDSPYANRVFDPETVDRWFRAPAAVRDRLMRYHLATNYSAVDMDVITDLYETEYTEKLRGERRLVLHGATELGGVTASDDGVHVDIVDLMDGTRQELDADMVVLATGFDPTDPRSLFGSGTEGYRFDERGPRVMRDYRLESTDPAAPAVFLNGGVEHTHGLTSTLLSNIAIRAGELAESLVALGHGSARTSAGDAVDRTPAESNAGGL